MDAIHRDFLDRDDVGVGGELPVGIQHLRQATALRLHEYIRQQQGERLIADDFARAPHRMPETKRLLLAGETGLAGARQIAREELELRAAIALRQGQFELELAVEVVLDDALVTAGDEDEMLDAGLTGLVDHVLDQRTVDHRQHFLRHCFGGRQKTRTEAGDRQDGFANGLHGGWRGEYGGSSEFRWSPPPYPPQTGEGRVGRNNCGDSRVTARHIPQWRIESRML